MSEQAFTVEVTTNQEGENNMSEQAFTVGEKVFIRTVTYHLTGKVVAIKGNFLVLGEAAWIADDGRFTQCIDEGKVAEVEPVKCLVRVNMDSIVDVYEWNHELPREQI